MVGCALYLQRSVPTRLQKRGGDRIHGAVRQMLQVHAFQGRERGWRDGPAVLQCVVLIQWSEPDHD